MNDYEFSDIEILREKIESILEEEERNDERLDGIQINIKMDADSKIDREEFMEMLEEVMSHHPRFKLKSGYMKRIHTP